MAEPHEQRQRRISDQNEVIAECDRFEADVVELRALYEQYFLGLEKRPPADRHAEMKRRLLKLKGLWVRQTAARFRVQAAAQKFATYERLWQRTLQEIENGTYKRGLARSRRRQAREATDANPEANTEAQAEAKAEGKAEPARPPSPADTVEITQLSDDTLHAVYDAFVSAKKRCNEDVSRMSFQQLAQTLRKQVPELMKNLNATSLELKVFIKDGKAVLRAIPKEG
jgi:hypothetical protein